VYEEDWRPTRVWIAKLGDSPEQPRALPLLDSAHEALWSPVDERILVTLAPTPLVDDEYMRQRIRIVDPDVRRDHRAHPESREARSGRVEPGRQARRARLGRGYPRSGRGTG
jgi:hypothetical protein